MAFDSDLSNELSNKLSNGICVMMRNGGGGVNFCKHDVEQKYSSATSR